jgi:environmental stress-induced protein Ves
VVPWANGLGTTAVIARGPDTDDWTWRLSLADVATDGPFSSLPGIDRWIAVASGEGMVLTIDDGEPVRIGHHDPAFAFDGGATTTCRLLDGPIRDLNLMLRQGTATGSLELHRLAPGETLHAPADTAAMVVLDGAVHCGRGTLHEGDALVVQDEPVGAIEAVAQARVAFARVRD